MTNMSLFSRMRYRFAILAFGLSCAVPAFAAEEKAAEPQGIVPIPAYGDDIWSRGNLTGDWGGLRTDWAGKGIQFDVDWVHWIDNAVDGGTSDANEVGGNFTYNMKVDLMRAGILNLAELQVRAESRYGNSGILNTGQIVPINTASTTPTNYTDFDDGYDIALTQLSLLKLFTPHFGMLVGKLDMFADGDQNEFATGRGRTGFNNWSMNYGTGLLLVPASTIGAGVVYLPSPELSISSLLTSGGECVRSDCFNDLNDKGGISATAATYQYNLGGLPGGVSGTFLYFFDFDFTDLQSLIPVPGEGLVGSDESKSWLVTSSFFQYLSADGAQGGPLNLTNRVPDLQGWGIFGRITRADDKTNPWKTSVTVGLGGRGVIPKRPNDVFGVGYFYNGLSVDRFDTSDFEDGEGLEAFYSVAITPALKFSFNAQWVGKSKPDSDDTTVLTGRFQLVF